ncbi:small ribosomal subunit protein mS33-like [Tubulanus polymorphus]|uniref:small ribosomal subunit protein mS33-like n=1 Tax=Tubulanus polymorphus TaxID=672921 RepID=UPI003DA45995
MASNYGKRMAHLSARIFNEVSRTTNDKSMKVVKIFSQLPNHHNKEITKWYPDHPKLDKIMKQLRAYGLYRDEHLDFVDEMERLRVLRGKGKVKRGEGKRALLKKE